MKKILFLAFALLTLDLKAQITLEHVYDTAGTWNVPASKSSQLMLINFEVSGEQYVKINRVQMLLSIYDLNHALVKHISLSNVPLESPYNTLGPVLYISEKLFNTDPKIEFMYVHEFTDQNGNGNFVTLIYNDIGALLFSDTSAAWIRPNFAQQQLPIYNTSVGTKMILTTNTGQARVFGLTGTLSTGIQNGNNLLLQQNNLSNAFPNPARESTTIDYTLPTGVNEGEIVLYNLNGTELKRYKIDRTFNSLLLSTHELQAGTYMYQLQTSVNSTETKKVVVIK